MFFHQDLGMRLRTSDVNWTAANSHIETTPSATYPGFHADPIGTKISVQPKYA